MSKVTVVVKTYRDAMAVAKALARTNAEAADRYMEVFPRRNSIEKATLENELSGG